MFNAKYYISSGMKNKLYTLRQEVIRAGGADGYDQYIKVLGNNYAEAVEKAKEYLGDRADLLCLDGEFVLGQIKRDGSSKDPNAELFNQGIMPWGKYKDELIEDIAKTEEGRQYLGWVAANGAKYVREALTEFYNEYIANIEANKKKREEEAAKIAALSQYVGSIGEKLVVDVEIRAVINIDTRFGGSNIIIMVDGSGNQYKAYYTGREAFQRGDKITIKGTVKAFDEYKGTKQTQLTRIKKV